MVLAELVLTLDGGRLQHVDGFGQVLQESMAHIPLNERQPPLKRAIQRIISCYKGPLWVSTFVRAYRV